MDTIWVVYPWKSKFNDDLEFTKRRGSDLNYFHTIYTFRSQFAEKAVEFRKFPKDFEF